MAKKFTNFDIKNYIYLRYDDWVSRGVARKKAKDISKEEAVKKAQKRLDDQFLSQTGVSAEDFIKKYYKEKEALKCIAEMIQAEDLEKILDNEGKNKETIQRLFSEKDELETAMASAKVLGYSNMLGIVARENELKNLQKIKKDLSETDFAKSILATIDDATSNKNLPEKEACFILIIGELMNNYNKISFTKEGKITGSFTLSSIETIQTLWDDVVKELGKEDLNIDLIKNKIVSIRSGIHKTLKSKNVSEHLTMMISNEIFKDFFTEELVETLNKTNKKASMHTGPKQSTNYIGIPVGLNLLRGGVYAKMGEYTTATQNFVDELISNIDMSFQEYINDKPDIVLNISLPNSNKINSIPISTKNYLSSQEKVSLANSNLPLGAALAMAEDQVFYDYLTNSNNDFRTRNFLNALNFYLAEASFRRNKTNSKISSEIKKYNGVMTFDKLDQLSGGMLTSACIDIFSGQFSKSTALFFNVSGVLIPSPIYFKKCIDFLKNRKKNITEVVKFSPFNSDKYRKVIRDSGSPKNDSEKEDYYILAARRNIAARQYMIQKQTVKVQAYFLKPDDFY